MLHLLHAVATLKVLRIQIFVQLLLLPHLPQYSYPERPDFCSIIAGILPPVISTPSPTETSATITWTQPEFSLPVVGYTVTATRLNGLACASYTESRLPVTTTSTVMSVQFTDLQEFSSYRTTVTAVFSATFVVTPASSNLEFTTHSAGMNTLVIIIMS